MTTPAGDPDRTARIDSDAFHPRRSDGSEVQFAPGTMVAGRYRIASILGSGGMGEVYRADDIKLGQTVALKFLPARLARHPILLARLHDEVRLGRQIAHPNVCRTYDIVDWEGAHFVAMEYVDGEDLSRLLKRIGRIAHDKAVDIARGIAAGLLAAHAKGILHRDLKPANVMIDSRGDSRIMDFGLALAAGEHDGTISGTPAYMAPEQLEGEPATIQTDLYALGLVMYELFTGRRVHNARTLPDRVRELSSEITTPSSVIRDIDPAVERIILRCLASDPTERPRSARQVIEALPGGDPLAAAIAAGETPSPRIVAAAATEGALKPATAWVLLGAVLLLFAVILVRNAQDQYWKRSGLSRQPAAHVERTTDMLRRLGLPPQQFRSEGFRVIDRQIAWLIVHAPERYRDPGPGFAHLRFWMREEPQPLMDLGFRRTPKPSIDEPPQHQPGSNAVEVDPRGRLIGLQAIPTTAYVARPLDWKPVLDAAGLAGAGLAPAATRLVPPSFADARAAWSGRYPEDGTPIHVEAAAFRGVPVFFRIIAPWDEEDATGSVPFAGGGFYVFGLAVVFAAIAIGAVMAWRNIRLRRGDRQGAFRVAAVLLVLTFVRHITSGDHEASFLHELGLVITSAGSALVTAVAFWLVYIALEPYIRRRWPQGLISWVRLLNGKWRDAMVGRDVLVGLLAGLFHVFLASSSEAILALVRHKPLPPFAAGDPSALDTALGTVSHIAQSLQSATIVALTFMVMLMLLMIVLRRRALAAIGLFALHMLAYSFASREPAMLLIFVLLGAVNVFVLVRFGLLSVLTAQAVFVCTIGAPLPDAIDWYTVRAIIPTASFLLLAAIAFRVSLGDQKPFRVSLLDE